MVTRTVLKGPNSICIYNEFSRDRTLKFLNEIDRKLLINYELITLDLSNVEDATAAASLLLFAIVNRAQLLRNDPNIVRFILPTKSKNPVGHRFIVKTGLARALNSGSIDKLEELRADEQFFQSSSEPMTHLFSTIDMLQSKAQLNDEQLLLLSSGISEAMLNVSHHAYEHKDFEVLNSRIGKRWWQCAWFDDESDSVIFILYDLGIGVFNSFTSGSKGSMPKTVTYEAEILKRAFTLGQTRFNQPERGKGSEDIKAPIRSLLAKQQSLLVYSGRARYTFESVGEKIQSLAVPELMPGTLIQWELSPVRRLSDD